MLSRVFCPSTDHRREEEGKSGASNVLSPRQTFMEQLEMKISPRVSREPLSICNHECECDLTLLHELRSDCLQDTAETALGTTRGK